LKAASPLWWSKPSAISRYAIAALSIALALVVAELTVVFLHTEPVVSLFLCAILFAAWFGGLGPGLFAVVLAFLAFDYYLVAPFNSFAVETTEIPRLVLFAITALFVSFLSASQRNTAETLRRSRDSLLAAMEDQRRVERALRHSEMYLAEAQRLSHTGSFGWNVSSGEIFWSGETFRILGYEKMPSATVDMVLQRVHPEDRALVGGTIDCAANDAKDFDCEHRLLMTDGSVKHIHAVAHAVRDASGGIEFVGTVMDVTAAKRAERKLHEAQTELAHATRVTTLGELTASIAHEVNQPLAGVVSSGNACLRWLASQPPNIENAKQSAERIIRDANRASEVIQRVRSLAKKEPLQKVWLNINETVLETLVLTRMEVAQHRASLSMQLSDDAPLVWTDRIQLQQVILNLIMNAIEAVSAVGDGPRDLLVSTAKHEADGVLLTVRDSGTGLDPEKLDHIFDAFYTTKREGMGMGLAVSRSIIEAHGGRLWASPNKPRGAVFQFTLPSNGEEAS
jgi:PAS domain S-box-containing protein